MTIRVTQPRDTSDRRPQFTAVFAGDIVSVESVDEMIAGDDEYRLGLIDIGPDGTTFGHNGAIPGYRSLVVHAPATGTTSFFAGNDDRLDFGPLVNPVVDAMAAAVAG